MRRKNKMHPLPDIMVAPNGARRTKADHPALPMTIAETVQTARACFDIGADGLHAHVRDAEGKHILDAGLYRELLDELERQVPDMYLQITTEAVGRYSPVEQRDLVTTLSPSAVSMSVREMLSEGETPDIARFYHEQKDKGVAIQHILYNVEDVELLGALCARNVIPADSLLLLFVIGRYVDNQLADPDDLDLFLVAKDRLKRELETSIDWACCAFGITETDCLLKSFAKGGKARIGFENNLHHADGSLAQDNADRVAALIKARQNASL